MTPTCVYVNLRLQLYVFVKLEIKYLSFFFSPPLSLLCPCPFCLPSSRYVHALAMLISVNLSFPLYLSIIFPYFLSLPPFLHLCNPDYQLSFARSLNYNQSNVLKALFYISRCQSAIQRPIQKTQTASNADVELQKCGSHCSFSPCL